MSRTRPSPSIKARRQASWASSAAWSVLRRRSLVHPSDLSSQDPFRSGKALVGERVTVWMRRGRSGDRRACGRTGRRPVCGLFVRARAGCRPTGAGLRARILDDNDDVTTIDYDFGASCLALLLGGNASTDMECDQPFNHVEYVDRISTGLETNFMLFIVPCLDRHQTQLFMGL